MIFPDTSFLCSVYRTQEHSVRADAFMAQRTGPIPVSSLLLLEFRQSLRLQVRLHTKDKTKGFNKTEATQMLRRMPRTGVCSWWWLSARAPGRGCLAPRLLAGFRLLRCAAKRRYNVPSAAQRRNGIWYARCLLQL